MQLTVCLSILIENRWPRVMSLTASDFLTWVGFSVFCLEMQLVFPNLQLSSSNWIHLSSSSWSIMWHVGEKRNFENPTFYIDCHLILYLTLFSLVPTAYNFCESGVKCGLLLLEFLTSRLIAYSLKSPDSVPILRMFFINVAPLYIFVF